MITIKCGNKILTVTRGAYNSMFASQGWEIVDGTKTGQKTDKFADDKSNGVISTKLKNNADFEGNTDQNGPNTTDDIPDDDNDNIDYSEIPISEMSVPQLQEYAKQLGLDFDTNSAKLLRNRIRNALSEG